MSYELVQGDCLKVMERVEDDSVDSIVTDPPYGLTQNKRGGSGAASASNETPYGRARIGTGNGAGGFMGMKWDSGVPPVEIWEEAYRVLKPGGYLLAFGGSRTYHRMVVNIEDAGFEIRDQIMWLYGSGFPKSHSVSKAIDKLGGDSAVLVEMAQALEQARLQRGMTIKECDDKFCNGSTNWNWIEGKRDRITQPSEEQMKLIAEEWSEMEPIFDAFNVKGNVVGSITHSRSGGKDFAKQVGSQAEKRAEIVFDHGTDPAKQWEGWGTALKPAHEPIVVARKPFKGTVAENVLEHGTGAMNIDGCRIPSDEEVKTSIGAGFGGTSLFEGGTKERKESEVRQERWPANVILDEEAGAMLGEESRFFYCPKASKSERNKGCEELEPQKMGRNQSSLDGGKILTGSGNERSNEKQNHHPTVKPVDLMKYLCRLVTPPGGVVLDPFMGSGTTGIAACVEGFNFIGIEREEDYIEIARNRIETWVEEKEEQVREERAQTSLFDW